MLPLPSFSHSTHPLGLFAFRTLHVHTPCPALPSGGSRWFAPMRTRSSSLRVICSMTNLIGSCLLLSSPISFSPALFALPQPLRHPPPQGRSRCSDSLQFGRCLHTVCPPCIPPQVCTAQSRPDARFSLQVVPASRPLSSVLFSSFPPFLLSVPFAPLSTLLLSLQVRTLSASVSSRSTLSSHSLPSSHHSLGFAFSLQVRSSRLPDILPLQLFLCRSCSLRLPPSLSLCQLAFPGLTCECFHRRKDPAIPHRPLAQRSEQGTHNPLVDGSNPSGPTPRSQKMWTRRFGGLFHLRPKLAVLMSIAFFLL